MARVLIFSLMVVMVASGLCAEEGRKELSGALTIDWLDRGRTTVSVGLDSGGHVLLYDHDQDGTVDYLSLLNDAGNFIDFGLDGRYEVEMRRDGSGRIRFGDELADIVLRRTEAVAGLRVPSLFLEVPEVIRGRCRRARNRARG